MVILVQVMQYLQVLEWGFYFAALDKLYFGNTKLAGPLMGMISGASIGYFMGNIFNSKFSGVFLGGLFGINYWNSYKY